MLGLELAVHPGFILVSTRLVVHSEPSRLSTPEAQTISRWSTCTLLASGMEDEDLFT
jgi:hypothetical protein